MSRAWALVAFALTPSAIVALLAWRVARRKDREAWAEHVAQALANVEPPGPPQAVIDRRSVDGCPHVRPGQTSVATVRIGGDDMALCGVCFDVAMGARRGINNYLRLHGVAS